jgi:uncharacterized protein YndB with AHSA1/START domain
MPVKKDGTGTRWVEMEFVTPGTPEQVWQAIATGPGNTAWFTRTSIDERVGGALRFEFDAGISSSGEVTEWEPPTRFGYVERDWSEGAPPVATEITITSRSGNQCVVRMVHSLFASTDDWDDQLEGFEKGWPGFFEVLRIYLSDFAGLKAASALAMVTVEGDQLAVWKRLVDGLGLAGADAGDRRTTSGSPGSLEPLSGVIERVQQDRSLRFIIMRLDRPASGVAVIGTHDVGKTTYASANLYFYGDDVAAIASGSEQKWRGWLREMFTEVRR